jgi:myo-inositol 2-dehydrogenase/D-chiro-inositol 1-dehydrogenase
MIGCGSFAQQCHGPAQRALRAANPGIELVACCDTNSDSCRAYSEAFGFRRRYSEIREMLSTERPDAVVLAVPPEVTCTAASLVLERGFPLLLEKPPGLTAKELERLIAAAEKGGVPAQVAFNRHYMPVMKKALEILNSAFRPEAVGRIDYEMIRFDRWDPDFSTTAVHALDAALFLARSPFRSAEISFQPQRYGGLEATNIAVEAECACGTRVRMNIQPVSAANEEFVKIHAIGQSLAIRVPVSPQSHGDGSVEYWRSDALVHTFSDRSVGAVERLGVLGETEAFLNAVGSGAPLAPRIQDCHQQVALMEAIRARRSGAFQFEAS